MIDGNNDITKEDTVKEKISNDDISLKRLKKIKGFLNQDDDAAIDGETMGVKGITVMRVLAYVQSLSNFYYLPSHNNYQMINSL